MNKDIFEENDRNIRVFGLETQKKLFESEVLIMNATPMMSELCKNLILSGAGICLFDDGSKVCQNDSEHNFFFNINDSEKKKVEILKEKIKAFKESCRISIISDINEIINKKMKYGAIDLSDDSLDKDKIKEIENIMSENKGILYYIKIENDKAVFLNNILEKKFLENNKNNNNENLFVKDEKIIQHMDLSDDEDENNNSEKKKENNSNEEKKDIFVNMPSDDEDEEKENEILKEDSYAFLNFAKKVEKIKDLIPKKMKKSEESVINEAFGFINNHSNNTKSRAHPLNCLCNYVIGGVVCHEIINCISRKKNPRTNIYYYDAFNGTGKFLNELYDKVIIKKN